MHFHYKFIDHCVSFHQVSIRQGIYFFGHSINENVYHCGISTMYLLMYVVVVSTEYCKVLECVYSQVNIRDS